MDDRELMDKIRKSMEDTPVPESLKPENIQKMLEEQSENHQNFPLYRRCSGGSCCNCGIGDFSGAAQDAYRGKARRHNIHSK